MDRLTDKESYCSLTECDLEGTCRIESCCYDRKLYDKLREYEGLDEQGLLLKPPCKVGDTLYVVEDINCLIHKGICNSFTFDRHTGRGWLVNIKFHYGVIDECWEDFASFGKVVFFTQEEAEAALKEMEKND